MRRQRLPGFQAPRRLLEQGQEFCKRRSLKRLAIAGVALHFWVTRSSAEACKSQLQLSSSHLVPTWSEAVAPAQLLPSSCLLSLRTQAGSLGDGLRRKAWQQTVIYHEMLPDACKAWFMSGRWCVLPTLHYNCLELLTNLPTRLPTNVPPLSVLHTPRGRSCWLLKETQRAEAQSLSLSHTYTDPHMQASQQRRSCSVLKRPQGSTARTRGWAEGWAPPAARRSRHIIPPQLSVHSYLAAGSEPWYHRVMTEFSQMYRQIFVVITSSNTVWACNIKTAWVYIQREYK